MDIAEYGHEERKVLGKRVGMGKRAQITDRGTTPAECKRRPKYPDGAKDIAIGKRKNARKRANQQIEQAIFVEEIQAWQ